MVIFTTDYLMRDGKDHHMVADYRFLGRARLEDHAIHCIGWPFFTPVLCKSPGNACWGEAFLLDRYKEDRQLEALDLYHQQAGGFLRQQAQVVVDGMPLNVWIYVGPTPDSAPLENWTNRPSIARPDRRRYARA